MMYAITFVAIIASLITLLQFRNATFFQTLLIVDLLGVFTPIIVLNYLNYRRTKLIEAHLPDFLRDVAESNRSGLTLEKAIESAAKGQYGPLTEEMHIVSAQISWGIPFEDALLKFSQRVESKLVRQIALIILESYKSGGAIADILETVSTDVRTLKEIETRRKSELQVYIISIYFIFLLFLAIIIVLSKTFLPATPQLNNIASILGGTVSKVSEEEFKTFFFHLSLIQAFFAGLISGQMGEGSVTAGFKHSFILIIVTLASFQLFLSPEPLASKVADEVLKLPPSASGFSTVEQAFTVFTDTSSAEIAKIVKERSTDRKLQGYEEITAANFFFTSTDCKPCTAGDITVQGSVVVVKKPTKVLFSLSNRKGFYTITIRGP